MVVIFSLITGKLSPFLLDYICRRKPHVSRDMFPILSTLCCNNVCACASWLIASVLPSLGFKKQFSSQYKIGWDTLVISGLQSLLGKMEAELDCLQEENSSVCKLDHELPPQNEAKWIVLVVHMGGEKLFAQESSAVFKKGDSVT